MHSSAALASLLLFPALAAAQGSWTFRSAVSNPPADSPNLTFDTVRNLVLLTVVNPTAVRNETWTWGGTNWQLRATSGAGQAYAIRHGALAFDAGRGVAVSFGGTSYLLTQPPQQWGGPGGSDQTWEWDGSSWLNTFALPAPPPRCKHAMVYDAARQRVLLFGGTHESGPATWDVRRDTWLWDGLNWTQRTPVSSPAARHGHALTYDSLRQRVVLFGGTNRVYTQPTLPWLTFNDTWEWDGSNWFQVQTRSAPSPRQEAALAFDPVTRRTLLFGGFDANGQPLGDTWAYDGSAWQQLLTAPAPANRYDAALAWDPVRGVGVLFGGSTSDWQNYIRDTWEFAPGQPASYTVFGSGCAGSRGTPSLLARTGSLPVAGGTFYAQLNNLPLSTAAFLFAGSSRTVYGALPLPLDLGPLGLTGCALRVSGDLLFPVTTVLGSGLWAFDIPLALAGQSFFNQAIVVDGLANPGGLTLSNGAEARVGY